MLNNITTQTLIAYLNKNFEGQPAFEDFEGSNYATVEDYEVAGVAHYIAWITASNSNEDWFVIWLRKAKQVKTFRDLYSCVAVMLQEEQDWDNVYKDYPNVWISPVYKHMRLFQDAGNIMVTAHTHNLYK